MRARWNAGALLAAAGAAALAGSCQGGFDDVSLVKDLRVLALVADPPEILVDDGGSPAATPVALRALVVDPAGGGRSLSYRIAACPAPSSASTDASNGVSTRCAPGDSEPMAAGEARPDGMSFTVTPSLDLLTRAATADPLSGALGLPIVLELTVDAGGAEVVAQKRALYDPRLRDDQQPNQNPVIPAVTLHRQPGDEGVVLDPGAPAAAPLGSALTVEPAPAVAEAYVTRVIDRDTGRFVTEEIPAETLRYAYFTDAGSFDPASTSSAADPLRTGSGASIASTYKAPAAMPADPQVTIWIVVRDERGGASWVTRTLRLE